MNFLNPPHEIVAIRCIASQTICKCLLVREGRVVLLAKPRAKRQWQQLDRKWIGWDPLFAVLWKGWNQWIVQTSSYKEHAVLPMQANGHRCQQGGTPALASMPMQAQEKQGQWMQRLDCIYWKDLSVWRKKGIAQAKQTMTLLLHPIEIESNRWRLMLAVSGNVLLYRV